MIRLLLSLALSAAVSARPPLSPRTWARVSQGGATPAASAKPILVVGSMNIDSTFEVDRFPSPGETVATPDPCSGKTAAGGKGANQAS